jgi:hypothetical protein
LQLDNKDSRADGVRRSGRAKKDVSGRYWHVVARAQKIIDPLPDDPLCASSSEPTSRAKPK